MREVIDARKTGGKKTQQKKLGRSGECTMVFEEINCAHCAASLSHFLRRERESGAEYARSLISIQSHARILRSYRVARSRELHSNFSTFDRKNVCDANVHFPRSVLVTVSEDIKVNSTMMFLQKRNLNCKLLFQENICNLNAMLLRICQRRNLIYFPSIL